MFSYLARLYESASALPNHAEQIVRRGGEILAAVRLLGGLPYRHHSPAGGTEARHSSRASVWGWEPSREAALAERVTGERRLRAAKARAQAREKKTFVQKGPPPSRKPRGDSCSSDTASSTQSATTQKSLARSRRRREKSKEGLANDASGVGVGVSDEPQNQDCCGGDAGCSSRDAWPSLWATPRARRRERINWHYPNFEEGFDIPPFNLPPPLHDPTDTAGGDSASWSQTHRRQQPLSEPVSPKTTPSSSANTTAKHSEEPSSAYATTDSEQPRHCYTMEPMEAVQSTTETHRTESSKNSFGSGGGGGLRLRRLRSALGGSSFLPRVPWSSASQSQTTSNSISGPNSEAPSPSISQRLKAIPTPWRSRRRAARPTAPAAAEPCHPVAEIALLSNRTTTTERVEEPQPQPAAGSSRDGVEVLTRTEEEFQQVLVALHDLRREMRLEREVMRSERRRSRGRGRRMERRGRTRSASRETARASEETVRSWLGGVPDC